MTPARPRLGEAKALMPALAIFWISRA